MTGAIRFEIGADRFDDWTGLHRLLTTCFAYMEDRIDPPSSLNRMTPESLRAKASEETLVLGFSGADLVACGFLKETGSAIYLGKIAVLPAFRGKGILRSIVGIAEDLARARGKPALELETRIELIENHQAFGALGFVRTAEKAHAGFARPTSITMTKRLDGLGP